MDTRPPALIESVVRLLVPPVAREHVLGDLAERYVSPGQYVWEALRTVPRVVASRIRRTSFFLLWPMIGFGLAGSIGDRWNKWSASDVIVVSATLIGFMFRDAYRVPDLKHPWRKGLVDVAVAAAFAAASQGVLALVRPEWLMHRRGVMGGAVALFILYLLRMTNPSGAVPGVKRAGG